MARSKRRSGNQKQPNPKPLCVFCRERDGIERGHVVPECFYLVQPNPNLPRVPSCPQCERGKGDGGQRDMNLDEDYVATFLGMDGKSAGHPEVPELLRGRIKRSLSNMPGVVKELMETIRYEPSINKFGIFDPKGRVNFGFDISRYERVFRKIIFGLYYLNNKKTPVPKDHDVTVAPRLPVDVAAILMDKIMTAPIGQRVGPFAVGEHDTFSYVGVRDPRAATEQLYLMSFYGHFYACGNTKPIGAPPVERDTLLK